MVSLARPTNRLLLERQLQVAAVGVPLVDIQLSAGRTVERCYQSDTVAEAESTLGRFGIEFESVLLSNASGVGQPLAPVRTAQHTPDQSVRSRSGMLRQVGLPVLCSCHSHPLVGMGSTTSTLSLDFASRCDVLLLSTPQGVHREAMADLLQAAPLSVAVLDEACVRHAGTGSFPQVGRACNVLVCTSSAARQITLTDSDSESARRLENMSRGATVVVVDAKSLMMRSRGASTKVNLQSSDLSNSEIARKVGATFAVGLLNEAAMEDVAYACAVAIDMEADGDKPSLDAVVEAGRHRSAVLERERAEADAKARQRLHVAALTAVGSLTFVALSAWNALGGLA